MAFPVSPGRRAGSAVFYGHGAADDHFKKQEVRTFLRRVADGLRDYLAGQELPMVLVGLNEMLSVYRDVNGHPHVIEDAVRQNPDHLSAEELHATAWPIVEMILGRSVPGPLRDSRSCTAPVPRRTTPPRSRRRPATAEWRLFLATEPWCWEQLNDAAAVVRLGIDEAFDHCELPDRAVADTLSGRGQVYAVPAVEVPGGGDVAAIYRY